MSNEIEILLGDNPFFGIDHLSQERARLRLVMLNNFNRMTDVMQFVSDLGVKGFVVSTHPQLKELVNQMRTKSNLVEGFDFYLILPYAQGYVTKVTEKGMVGAVNDILSGGSMQKKLKIFFDGSIGLMKKDFGKLLQTFIDVELLSLDPVRKKAIFLHDVITDLAISLGMKNVIETFVYHIKDHYNTDAGLVTKNFPKLTSKLKEWQINIPVIMTSFNPIGYQMNPSQKECEECLQEEKRIIAMNVLAGGFLKPHESAQYISKLGINSAVVGMSTKEHAKETVEAFRRK